jgi:hypothetical protein
MFKRSYVLFRRDMVENVIIVMTHEFYVPEYIEQLAHDVHGHYDLSVQSMQVVTTKPDKGGAIWKLETKGGPKSLKLLHRRPTRSLFSLGAQEYLVDVQRARVPAIVWRKTLVCCRVD